MANPKGGIPPVHKRFQKGVSGNPAGNPKNLLTTSMLRSRISKVLAMTKDEIAKVMQDKNSTALELILVSGIAKAIKDGDLAKCEYLFNRSLGKIKEMTDENEPVIRAQLKLMSTDELLKIVKDTEPEKAKNDVLEVDQSV